MTAIHPSLHSTSSGFTRRLRRIAALLLLIAPLPATALEFTAIHGTQSGGQLAHISTDSTLGLASRDMTGLIVGWPVSHFQDMEVYYSRQSTRLEQGEVAVDPEDLIDLEIHTLHWGGTVLFDQDAPRSLQGFLSGGLGVTRYSPSLGGASAETRPSASLGVGLRWMPSEQLGLRLEGRLYGSLFNSNTTIFCSGGCSISVKGDLLSQYALFAGLVVRFK